MIEDLAREYKQKIEDNLDDAGFDYVSSIFNCETTSYTKRIVYQSDDYSITFLISDQNGWCKCSLDFLEEVYRVEWNWQDLEELESYELKQFTTLEAIRSFISENFFSDYNIIPIEEEAQDDNLGIY